MREEGNVFEVGEGSEANSYNDLLLSHKLSVSDIKEHITGPVLSTILHIFLLSFMGTVIISRSPEKEADILIKSVVVDPVNIEPPPPIEIPQEEPLTTDSMIDNLNNHPDVDEDLSVSFDDMSLDTINDIQSPSNLNISMNNSALTIPVKPALGSSGRIGCNFFTAKSSGRRFLFILDYSSSMSNAQLLVLKSHLIKALTQLNGKGEVALLFFAGPVWLPEQDGSTVKEAWGGGGKYEHFDKKDMSRYYPTVRWFVPNKHNLEIVKKYICTSHLVGGTNWSHPFRIALEKMNPKPDVIFFMTDGSVGSSISEQCLELVRKYGKNITINTIGFGITSGPLQDIASLSDGGQFIGYSKEKLKSMAQGVTLPSDFTQDTKLDYTIPKAVKSIPEPDVKGLIVE